jgi:hypothetical protein
MLRTVWRYAWRYFTLAPLFFFAGFAVAEVWIYYAGWGDPPFTGLHSAILFFVGGLYGCFISPGIWCLLVGASLGAFGSSTSRARQIVISVIAMDFYAVASAALKANWNVVSWRGFVDLITNGYVIDMAVAGAIAGFVCAYLSYRKPVNLPLGIADRFS